MCLGIPMRIIESDGFTALCEGRGEERRVNMMLVDEAAPETWGLVHMGNAVHILDAGARPHGGSGLRRRRMTSLGR